MLHGSGPMIQVWDHKVALFIVYPKQWRLVAPQIFNIGLKPGLIASDKPTKAMPEDKGELQSTAIWDLHHVGVWLRRSQDVPPVCSRPRSTELVCVSPAP